MNKVKTAVKHGGFSKAYYSMPHNQLASIQNELKELCDWSRDTFRKRVSGISPVRKLEIPIIEGYFADRGINAWTGEPINN